MSFLTGWALLKYDDVKEDMRIRERRTGRLAIIGVKEYGRVTIVDQNGHVETLTKNELNDWNKV
jgi:hypothetical protein